MNIGIGIDTGGTCTDAVLYDFDTRTVLATGKAQTTRDHLETGIANALDALPPEQLKKAKLLSLSTTLATNACVENKGGRAKLILLGSTRKVMDWIDAGSRYGLKNEDVLCIDSESVRAGKASPDEDWFRDLMAEDEWLSDAQAFAVAELNAARDGAACEKLAGAALAEKYHVPQVGSHTLASGLNIMERGATALLNARLLPVIEDFLQAVRNVLEERHLSITEMIVRSDGSLMSEEVALLSPVQTILSGPAASVIGVRSLAECENCLIIDMGGTTTDISLVKNNLPETSSRITIGGYRTQVKGVYIDTFGLGGDSRIAVSGHRPVLEARRVRPLCAAAAEYPRVKEQLQALLNSGRTHTCPLHEWFFLVKEPGNPKNYTPRENQLIEKLRDHPMMLGSGEIDIYNTDSQRLEDEGIIQRCGLTPTDIMHIRGDFTKFDRTASVLGARYVMRNLEGYGPGDLDRFCEDIYDLVCEKLYENIVKILLTDTFPQLFDRGVDEPVTDLIRHSWEEPESSSLINVDFRAKTVLVGAGAPIRIFLPRVAEKMKLPCIIPPHAEVANAVGTITADISARCQVVISPLTAVEGTTGYRVQAPDGVRIFEEREPAVAWAKETAAAAAKQEARIRGAVGELQTEVQVKENIARDRYGSEVELDTCVEASARGKIYE